MSNFISTSHPADNARMTVMLDGLRRIGFINDAKCIADHWKEFLLLADYQPEPEYIRCYAPYILENLTQIAYEAIEKMGCRIANPSTTDIVHNVLNSAWTKFWEDPMSYTIWEIGTISQLRKQLTIS
jgi:hypothetical protein